MADKPPRVQIRQDVSRDLFHYVRRKALQDKGEDIFHNWTQSTLQQSSLKAKPSEHSIRDIDVACLYSIDTLMKEHPISHLDTIFTQMDQSATTPRELRLRKRLKLTENGHSSRDSTKGQTSTATVMIDKDTTITQGSTEGQNSTTTVNDTSQNKYVRTTPHPLHVISTLLPPDPIETWPDKQS